MLGGISPIDPLYIRRMEDQGVLGHIDAVAVHGFPLDWNHWNINEWPAKLEEIRTVTALPLWVSEVGVSTFGADEVQEFGLKRTAELLRGRVIANGRGSARFRPGRKEPVILSAGRLWDEAKNFETLAAAAPEVHWPIVAAGAIHEPTAAAEGGERFQAIRWFGPLNGDELAGWYARAAIYALPARYEPFGLTPLEAALSGCALVLGDIGSLHEVWGDAARYVSPNDPCALREALNEVAAAPRERTALAARALERARTYTPERMAEAYLDLYRELLGAPAAARQQRREGASAPRARAPRAAGPRASKPEEHPA